jgi:uncharacterized membrane protein
MKQSRLQSKVVWLAVLGQVLLIVGAFIPDITDEVKLVAGAVIEILTVFGILNNPTDKESF